MKRLLTTFCLFTLCILPFNEIGHTQQGIKATPVTEPFKFKVYVSVTCDDKQIKSSIESYVKRELRSLHDVDIVSLKSKPPFEIVIVALQGKYKETKRKSDAIAFAVNFLQRNSLDWSSYLYPELSVFIGDIRDLEHFCKSVVVAFDTETLEPVREFFE
ncbi:MAG: hypothetical protein OXI43_02775 [Candidatus Poribacteria bacterium]|nr:hypothetical protein [Candidatus Poribacteria bacterium]